ncbi:MAG: fasciclin domain-containing protein [Caldilinea sp.]|nr:fasciclin domain-containing protein [Caldilinea sp.]MDW8441069.1 fasciclin domain-containing protein [Caldilineaceae bacterium]
MKERTRRILQLLLALLLVVGAAPLTPAFAQDADIVDTAIAAGDFNTLVTAVQSAGLVEALKGEGPFTVFAPTDEAFAKLPPEVLQAALDDPEGLLTQVLLYHVVAGKVMASDLSDGLEVATLQGESVKFTLGDGVAMVNDANIVAADIEASNGVIHVIDSVLLPPSVIAAAAAAEEAAEPVATPAPTEELADIVDTAVAAGSFNTLVAAVQAAGLVDALRGAGPFTVFAPTDDAFAKLPAGTIDALLADPTGDLTQILLYHVVPGKVMSTDLSDGLEASTLQGGTVVFTLGDGGAKVNDANIVAADIEASNGVIHVIDSVLLPPAAESESVAEATPTPALLPVTGGEPGSGLNVLLATGLLLLAIVGFAFAWRRRPA